MKLAIPFLFILFVSVSAQIDYPPVPPGLPPVVAISGNGHTFRVNIYTGVWDADLSNGTHQSGVCRLPDGSGGMVWHGRTDRFNGFGIPLGSETVISGSQKRGVVVWIDACTGTGQIGFFSGQNLRNETPVPQCTGTTPPNPASTFRCITESGNSLRWQRQTGYFTLDGPSHIVGTLAVAFDDGHGFSVLRRPSADFDITVIINGNVGTVIVLFHGARFAEFSGAVLDCQ